MKKQKIRPLWMKKPLKNEKIDAYFKEIIKFCTDGCVQKIYEYIQELEEKDEKTD